MIQLIPTLQNKPPEVIQHAVSSMKENAGDVIAGLKGRVQAISVRNKPGIEINGSITANLRSRTPSENSRQSRKRLDVGDSDPPRGG